MKKFIFTAVLTLAFVAQSYAQSAYFLFDEGAKLTIANTDAKGKHTGYSTLEVKAGHMAVIAQISSLRSDIPPRLRRGTANERREMLMS